METITGGRPDALAYEGAMASLQEVVFGVHWTPSASAAEAADLDALCEMYDAQGRLHEVVHKDRPRGTNDSVVHTGDSHDGSSCWDDERIFVFPDALPQSVASLAFIVRSVDRRAFHEVPGAVCHLSHPASEHEWLRIDLTALHGQRSLTVATLQRKDRAWVLSAKDERAVVAGMTPPGPSVASSGSAQSLRDAGSNLHSESGEDDGSR